MAKTLSTMLPLGTSAPRFSLPDTAADGEIKSLSKPGTKTGHLVMFICNHCPYVVHVREALVKTSKQLIEWGFEVVAISSNDVSQYPDDAPEKMRDLAKQFKFPFPYLFDESQAVAKAYQAACTPDFFLFDQDQRLVYRGQMDSSRPGNDQPNDGRDLLSAAEAVRHGKAVSPEQQPSMGCNIKWKPAG